MRRRPLSDAPDRLEDAERARIRVWAASTPDLPLGRLWASCRDWHRSRGILRADWEATFRNWLRMELALERSGDRGTFWDSRRRLRPKKRVESQEPERMQPEDAISTLLPVNRTRH